MKAKNFRAKDRRKIKGQSESGHKKKESWKLKRKSDNENEIKGDLRMRMLLGLVFSCWNLI